jgi:hypothetical protein
MKKILLFLIILLSFANTISAQEPDVSQYFGKTPWRDYLCKKTALFAMQEYDLDIPAELEQYEDSDEEDDSVFIQKVVEYFESPANRTNSITWVAEYIKQKYPRLNILLAQDQGLIEMIINGFGDYFSGALLEDLERMKDLEQ